jgi:hypothetical protein
MTLARRHLSATAIKKGLSRLDLLMDQLQAELRHRADVSERNFESTRMHRRKAEPSREP